MLAKVLSVAALVVLLPSFASAQASIAGVVRDASGAVLPGVTVEAASPALIEKSRTVVTDGTGQYRIEDLRPGAYIVTFTLEGFAVLKREGIELTGTFVATINAELRVGLAETLTVSGESPIVDVQSTAKQRVMSSDVIEAIPTGRSDHNLAMLIPGMSLTSGTAVSQDVGGTVDQTTSNMSIHNSRTADQRITYNGLSVGTTASGGSNTQSLVNTGAYQEVTIDTGAVSAEFATGGPRINFVPKDGGNRFSGSAFANFANSSMQGSNFTDALKASGLQTPDALKSSWDINPAAGGPIIRDRLWVFAAYRKILNESYPANIFVNLNANNPSLWTYAPDLSSRPFNHMDSRDVQVRLTWQLTPKLKLGWTDDDTSWCACSSTINSNTSPEAAFYRAPNPGIEHSDYLDWTSPLTNRLLFDGGIIARHQYGGRYVPTDYSNPAMIAVTDQAKNNFVYRTVDTGSGASPNLRFNNYRVLFLRSSVSYTVGGHFIKVGTMISRPSESNTLGNTLPGAQQVGYRFNNGVPNQITLFGYPLSTRFNVSCDCGVYMQDRWTRGRLTASGAVRYDYASTSFPAQTAGPTILLPTRNISFAEGHGISWHDISPRVGVAYDLFGNGKTAVKASLNKYLDAIGNGGPFGSALAPISLISSVTTRSWTDRNGNFIPDCDIRNPAAQTVTGGDICGAMANQNFGQPIASASYDASTLSGFGIRGYNWEFSTGVQQQVMPRVSVDATLFRRWYGNFFVTDNLAVAASDYTAYSVTAPATDSRLPSAGQPITGFFDLNPNKVGQVNSYITKASNYGGQSEDWTGVDVNVVARLPQTFLLQGGVSSGVTSLNSCAVRALLPETATANPFCSTSTPALTQVKFLAAYTVPHLDVQISGTMQSIPGPIANASYAASNALIQPSLGRPLSGNAANATVQLVGPSTLYFDRINQVDLRVGKIFRFNQRRVSVNADIFNALNGNAALSVNNTFGGTIAWQQTLSILTARFVKVGMQLDF